MPARPARTAAPPRTIGPVFRRTAPAPPRPRVVAASDCETCRHGAITQPANTVSSLAYVVAGADLLRGPDPDRPFAWSVIAVGLGSVAYHGPGGVAGKWAHDASLLAMLGLMTLSDLTVAEGKPMPPAGIGAITAAAAVAAHPKTTDWAQAAAGATALLAEGRRYRREASWRSVLVGGPLWLGGLTAQLLGRTDGPWCAPDSPVQAHAVWHTLSAGALWSRRRFSQAR